MNYDEILQNLINATDAMNMLNQNFVNIKGFETKIEERFRQINELYIKAAENSKLIEQKLIQAEILVQDAKNIKFSSQKQVIHDTEQKAQVKESITFENKEEIKTEEKENIEPPKEPEIITHKDINLLTKEMLSDFKSFGEFGKAYKCSSNPNSILLKYTTLKPKVIRLITDEDVDSTITVEHYKDFRIAELSKGYHIEFTISFINNYLSYNMKIVTELSYSNRLFTNNKYAFSIKLDGNQFTQLLEDLKPHNNKKIVIPSNNLNIKTGNNKSEDVTINAENKIELSPKDIQAKETILRADTNENDYPYIGKNIGGKNLSCVIYEHFGNLNYNNMPLEFNKISWDGAPAKYDIRRFSTHDHHPSRGIVFNENELRGFKDILNNIQNIEYINLPPRNGKYQKCFCLGSIESDSTWHFEINVMRYPNADTKFDIRKWNTDNTIYDTDNATWHTDNIKSAKKQSISLNKEELQAFKDILNEKF